jgi:hypothetical protein
LDEVPDTLVEMSLPVPPPGPTFPGAEPGFTFTCADAPTAKPTINAVTNAIVRFMHSSVTRALTPPVTWVVGLAGGGVREDLLRL